MIFLISFSTFDFFASQKILELSAKKNGVEKVINFNSLWLERQQPFYNSIYTFIKRGRGYGYWVWKPYIILTMLKKINQGDFLIYSDASIEIINDLEILLKLCLDNNGLTLFRTCGRKNGEYTKRDCFYYMDCDKEEFHKANQIMGGFMILQKTNFTQELIREWLYYCQDAKIISDEKNICGLPNLNNFIDHRHDQSVLSLLAKKYNINLYRDPSQWGNNWKIEQFRVIGEFLDQSFFGGDYSPNPCEISLYPTLLFNHRRKRMIKNKKLEYIKYFLNSLIFLENKKNS